jgi:hypothetical protein
VGHWIGSWVVDIKHSGRVLSKQRGFATTVALTLALGLGLNATVLGMIDAMLLRPFQFPEYERLVVVWESADTLTERQPVAPANFLDLRRESTTRRQLVAWEPWAAVSTAREEAPERIQAVRVSPLFIDLLGALAAGRSFHAAEEQSGQHRVVIIGDGLWKRRFGADPRIVGSQIRLDGRRWRSRPRRRPSDRGALLLCSGS